MEHSKWAKEIPFIKFKEDWEVKVVPPYSGAVVRFHVQKGSAHVSVYLDCYDALGYVEQPYWEIYPDIDGDTYRCLMHETEKLLSHIELSLKNQ